MGIPIRRFFINFLRVKVRLGLALKQGFEFGWIWVRINQVEKNFQRNSLFQKEYTSIYYFLSVLKEQPRHSKCICCALQQGTPKTVRMLTQELRCFIAVNRSFDM